MLTIEKIKPSPITTEDIKIGDFLEYNDTIFQLICFDEWYCLIDIVEGEWEYRFTSLEKLLENCNVKLLNVHMKISYK